MWSTYVEAKGNLPLPRLPLTPTPNQNTTHIVGYDDGSRVQAFRKFGVVRDDRQLSASRLDLLGTRAHLKTYAQRTKTACGQAVTTTKVTTYGRELVGT